MANIKGTNVSSPIVPFSTQDIYPTHEAAYGKGGFRTVNSVDDLDLISMQRREEGMLVYAINDPRNIHAYQWLNGEWVRSNIGNSIERIATWSDLVRPISTMEPGQLVFVESENQFYYLDDNQQWIDWGNIHIGPDAPLNKNAIWIDNANAHYDSSTELLHSFQKELAVLKTQVNVLLNIRMAGAVSGKISDGARTDIMSQTINEDGVSQMIIPDALAEMMDEEDYEDLIDEDTEEIKPNYAVNAEPTVNHISIKMGTWEEMDSNRQNFIDGELIWCTDRTKLYIYIKGSLLTVGSGINGGSDSEETTDMTESEIQKLINSKLNGVTSIGFIPMGADEEGGAKYIMRVNSEGKLITYDPSLNERQDPPTSGNYYYSKAAAAEGIVINSFYLGGLDNDEHSYQPCSHNFVELANVKTDSSGNTEDINLNGFYLCYLGSNKVWHKLPLWGVIPAGGTFLIRGAQCSVMNSNTTIIKVKTYDMQWYYEDKPTELIRFDQKIFGDENEDKGVVFYLAWATEDGLFYDIAGGLSKTISSTTNLIDVNSTPPNCARGYIDLASINYSDIKEKSAYALPSNRTASEVIFRRWYPLDPVTQSNPKDGLDKHNNKKYLTATLINGANYSDHADIQDLTPKASFEGKTISATRTLFSEDYPSTLTCSFGIQATDNYTYFTAAEASTYNTEHSLTSGDDGYVTEGDVKSGVGATRCFCWNSVGYYDEYIWYRKITEPSSAWIKVESIKTGVVYTSTNFPGLAKSVYNAAIQPYYNRVRWESAYGQSVTTHRVLIGGLTEGEYEYLVVRGNQEGDDTTKYHSKTRRFTVRADSNVTSFNFVQVTDQQGANWEEYEVWNLSARIIAEEERKYKEGWTETTTGGETVVHAPGETGIPEYDFIINTGDICYNGSRSNEWIDYYIGYEPLDNKEEMLTIGNNDLAPISMMDIGNGKESPWKINTYVIDYFYTFEIDPDNPQIFTGKEWDPNADNGQGGKGAVTNNDVTFKMPSLYSFNYGQFHFICLLSEMRTISNTTEISDSGEISYKNLAQSTVNAIYGVHDKLRNNTNKAASWIYDVEEEWIIKDLLKWKGVNVTTSNFQENFDRETARFSSELVNNCRDCIIFTHEMPFNIISNSAYANYEDNNDAPRETAKAYLNRYHNFEYQRLFKLWGIPMVMGGHKHTCAITQPVYDAPLYYNPISKQIEGDPSVSNHLTDDILNDSGKMFNSAASFQPFMQVLASDFSREFISTNGQLSDAYNYCTEIYNNSSSNILVDRIPDSDPETYRSVTLLPGEYVLNRKLEEHAKRPRVRLEVVDEITAPSYVMCQATGFKNKSNSDLAGEIIPWERHYVPCAKNESQINIKEQLYPFYTVYKVSPTDIVSYMYKIVGMYKNNKNDGSPAGYWDIVQIYANYDTLEENRQAVLNKCVSVLYNQRGNTEGTTIIL